MSRFDRSDAATPGDKVAEKVFDYPVLYSLKTAIVRTVAGAVSPLWFRNRFDPIEVALPELRGKKVLEIGCGSGYLYDHIRKKKDVQVEYVGSDVNEHMVAFCREKYPEACWVQLRELPYPYADGEFDVVLIWNVIHHLNDYRDVLGLLSEAIRIAPSVIMFEPLQSNPRMLRLLKSRYWRITDGGKYYFTRREWQDVFERVGAEIVWARMSEPLNQIILAKIRSKAGPLIVRP
jgi:2-polyprenyl-3-methyl-5-hydroxy-6-metoxy-1,4-benzoquinol methylase